MQKKLLYYIEQTPAFLFCFSIEQEGPGMPVVFRAKQYSSASDALSSYINDFEGQEARRNSAKYEKELMTLFCPQYQPTPPRAGTFENIYIFMNFLCVLSPVKRECIWVGSSDCLSPGLRIVGARDIFLRWTHMFYQYLYIINHRQKFYIGCPKVVARYSV